MSEIQDALLNHLKDFGVTDIKQEDKAVTEIYSFVLPPHTGITAPGGCAIIAVQPLEAGILIVLSVKYPEYFLTNYPV